MSDDDQLGADVPQAASLDDEASGVTSNVDENRAARLAALEAEGEAAPEEESALPRFRVELTCPTPVPVRVAEYHAENANDAQQLHRQANGLVGAIAGAMQITQLSKAPDGTWVEAV